MHRRRPEARTNLWRVPPHHGRHVNGGGQRRSTARQEGRAAATWFKAQRAKCRPGLEKGTVARKKTSANRIISELMTGENRGSGGGDFPLPISSTLCSNRFYAASGRPPFRLHGSTKRIRGDPGWTGRLRIPHRSFGHAVSSARPKEYEVGENCDRRTATASHRSQGASRGLCALSPRPKSSIWSPR